MEKGQEIKVDIIDLTIEGYGIGKSEDGYTVFVNNVEKEAGAELGISPVNLVYGEQAKVKLTKCKKNYGFGTAVSVTGESGYRIPDEERCPYLRQCGGCAFGEMSYEGQLVVKENHVRNKLERIGGVDGTKIRSIMACDEPYRYRNKASMPVSTGGLITEKGGIQHPVHEPRVGFFKGKSHEVTDCEDCSLQSEPAMACADALRRWMEEDHITSYDPRWEKGLMRHMIVRTAKGTGEVMVVLVINGKGLPNAEKLVSYLDDAVFEVPVYEEGPYAGVEWNLTSVVVNVNKKNTSEILGDECITIAGNPTITEEIVTEWGDVMKFEVSPLSFYQVNPDQMVRLYDKAIEYADLKGNETVLDLYCGVGTIGLFAARYMEHVRRVNGIDEADMGTVIGIESVKGAILDANRNAVINGIVNARYFAGKAEVELPLMMGLTREYKFNEVNERVERFPEIKVKKVDVVFLDPPRAGCDERLLNAVIQAGPSRIVYVSCDPATLARDVRFLTEKGYEFVEATPVDMFPHTAHCEVVSVLEKI